MQPVNPPPATTRPAVVPHVHVRAGGCDIAIPIEQVRQAVPLRPQGLMALPRRTGALLGVADVAGAAVPVVALERWLPLPTAGDEHTAAPRLLVLQHAGAQVGVRVDAVLGVKPVPAENVRKVHHTPDDSELFESVVPASAAAPMLCILEVERLMRLTQAWFAAEQLAAGAPAGAAALAAQTQSAATQRFAVFRIGPERWAVPVAAVQQVVPLPATDLALGRNDRTWAIGQWRGRKLPLVDISEGRQASDRQAAPWMVLLGQGPLVLGLTVSECEQLVDLPPDAVARTPDDALVAGVALCPGVGRLQILDVDKLFGLTPGASISRVAVDAAQPRSGVGAEAAEPVPYLVFDADQRYASPVEGIVGVVELPPEARDDLRQSRRAVLAWRGHTVRVVSLPAIARSAAAAPEPLLAVLVQAPGDASAPVGIAIRSLCDWLPAHSALRSGMRMGAMGELGLINAKGAVADHANLVVVDLAQMAYLLG